MNGTTNREKRMGGIVTFLSTESNTDTNIQK